MSWNQDKERRLRELWDAGMTMSLIAAQLGITKNAVCGRVHRLHLAPRPSPIRRSVEGVVGRRKMPKVCKPGQPTLPPLAPTASAVELAVDVIELIPAHNEAVDPASPPCSVSPAKIAAFPRVARPCCWPLGELKTPSFRFCEDPSELGRSYCPEHAAIAYVRVPRMELVTAA